MANVNKTRQTEEGVTEFLAAIPDQTKRDDCLFLLSHLRKLTKATPKMWGGSIVGFGSYHYKYESGREGDWFKVGFSPRKTALTIYLMSGFENEKEIMANLGKYKIGKSCLYLKELKDISLQELDKLVNKSMLIKDTY